VARNLQTKPEIPVLDAADADDIADMDEPDDVDFDPSAEFTRVIRFPVRSVTQRLSSGPHATSQGFSNPVVTTLKVKGSAWMASRDRENRRMRTSVDVFMPRSISQSLLPRFASDLN